MEGDSVFWAVWMVFYLLWCCFIFHFLAKSPQTPPHAPRPFVILSEFEIQEAEHSQLHLDTVF